MAASYPLAIKAFTTKIDLVTDVMAVDVNDLQDEVVALESIIGVDPLTMKNKDPNQATPWTTIAERLDALDAGLTTPIFSAWSDATAGVATSVRTSTWSAYQPYGLADSPDNFPGGEFGQHPSYAPAYEMPQNNEALANSHWPYGFEWNSQSAWVSYKQADVRRSGGEADGTQYRTQVITVTTVPSAIAQVDGLFVLQPPAAGNDPLGWFNGSTGFTIKKTGWYLLTASMKWSPIGSNGSLKGTHRFNIMAGNKAVAMEDIDGSIGSDGLYVTTSYTGVIPAGTDVGLAASVYQTSEFRAERPRLSGVFLRSA